MTSGRKPPDAVLTESQEPARARGDVVSSIDKLLEGRVAGLKCWDVDLLSVFSARAAILSRRGRRLAGREARQSCYCSPETSYAAEFSRVVDGVTSVQCSNRALTPQRRTRRCLNSSAQAASKFAEAELVCPCTLAEHLLQDAMAPQKSPGPNTGGFKFKLRSGLASGLYYFVRRFGQPYRPARGRICAASACGGPRISSAPGVNSARRKRAASTVECPKSCCTARGPKESARDRK